jgi:hypothetical protein
VNVLATSLTSYLAKSNLQIAGMTSPQAAQSISSRMKHVSKRIMKGKKGFDSSKRKLLRLLAKLAIAVS